MHAIRSLLSVTRIRLGVLLLTAVAAFTVWTGTFCFHSISAANQEEKSHETVRNLIEKLDGIRKRSPHIQDSATSSQESISVIRQGLESASIPESVLEDMRFGQQTPIPPSTLVREELTLVLRSVTLRQINDFLTFVARERNLGVCTKLQLDFDERNPAVGEEKWVVQLTLTRLTGSGKSPSIRR